MYGFRTSEAGDVFMRGASFLVAVGRRMVFGMESADRVRLRRTLFAMRSSDRLQLETAQELTGVP